MRKIKMQLYSSGLVLRVLFFPFMIFSVSCTGASLLTTYGIKGNTHPVKEYGHSTIYLKGGWFYHGNSLPGQIGSGDLTGEKKMGKSCSQSYFYLISLGDSSIQEACKQAKITQIISTQNDITALLGGFLYHKHCTIVVGISDGSWAEPEMIYR